MQSENRSGILETQHTTLLTLWPSQESSRGHNGRSQDPYTHLTAMPHDWVY